jgi:hypothetical protein
VSVLRREGHGGGVSVVLSKLEHVDVLVVGTQRIYDGGG